MLVIVAGAFLMLQLFLAILLSGLDVVRALIPADVYALSVQPRACTPSPFIMAPDNALPHVLVFAALPSA